MANSAVILPAARVGVLPLPERTGGFTHRFRVNYTDLQPSGGTTGSTDTVTVTLGSLPTNFFVNKALLSINTAFAGVTSQALTVTLGITTSAACILSSNSVTTAGPVMPASGASVIAAPATASGSSGGSLVATFTNATAGSPSTLTAGQVDIFLGYHNPQTIDGPYLNQ